ncbi:MerR family transcriptional regulator [Rhodococcus aerolatus]
MTEQRIDDLARAAGTTVRNVRVYQDRGLLPPPRRQGRTGWYSEAHLARLQLITRLLDRGYTFATIGELLTAAERNLRVEDVLGLEDVLSRPWSDETAGTSSRADLRRSFGPEATPALLERACELGFLRRHGSRYAVASPRLLAAARDLVAAGFPLADVLELAGSVQHDITRVAHRFVSLVADHYLPDGAGRDISAEQLGEAVALVERARPHASAVVHAIFARAMEKEIDEAFDTVARRFTSAHRDGAHRDGAAGDGTGERS